MLSGTRKIFNVMYPNQVIDLQQGGSTDGTPITGYAYDANGTNQHQRWFVQVLEMDAEGNNITVKLTNNGNGIYMRAEQETLGRELFGSHIATKWTLVKQNDMGQYMIQAQEGELVCVLENGENSTPITLAVPDDGDNSQLWTLSDT
ncbi:uncharacterized protein HD556DRAFT_1402761 [Suillus plorans]|uniref:Ricin B lectin domain-containing protein n=1 Tax=Suillus plorans TaxID=116603 RepID=A0A9P7DDK7_9AGAM|nr:uncharacterized protein HD556DRAFT_1402761 [Suillus plorans]KAG1788537.1 hypothetical protein HD556DRAFT_1402761 [Suillus plorans]